MVLQDLAHLLLFVCSMPEALAPPSKCAWGQLFIVVVVVVVVVIICTTAFFS